MVTNPYGDNADVVLEQIIDAHGLTFLVDTLCGVIYRKAAHIRENWQDEALAAKWDKAGHSLVNPKPEFEGDFPS